MSREYPDWLDPRKAAEGKRIFTGTLPLNRMVRLQPLLANSEGKARFSTRFAFDQQARVTIDIEVEASLPLICQRSLEPYQELVQRRSLLGVIESMTEEAEMPDNYEPVLVENGRLALLDLVEDELLLGVPQVPRNPEAPAIRTSDDELGSVDADKTGSVRQPFAGLAEQMEKHENRKKKGR